MSFSKPVYPSDHIRDMFAAAFAAWFGELLDVKFSTPTQFITWATAERSPDNHYDSLWEALAYESPTFVLDIPLPQLTDLAESAANVTRSERKKKRWAPV